MTGKRYGMLQVISFSHEKNGASYWLCLCDCGNHKTVLSGNLKGSKTKSCGCLQKLRTSEASKTHGGARTRLYGIWKGMHNRCKNPNVSKYKNYGGRGICVCSEWEEYETFRDWALNNGYADTLTIERLDFNGNYEPSNCTWITLSEQGKNTSKSRLITHEGETLSLVEWSRKLGGNPNLVTTRLQRGWSEKDAVSIPPKG